MRFRKKHSIEYITYAHSDPTYEIIAMKQTFHENDDNDNYDNDDDGNEEEEEQDEFLLYSKCMSCIHN